jgi:hypothetical protein
MCIANYVGNNCAKRDNKPKTAGYQCYSYLILLPSDEDIPMIDIYK